MDVQIAALKKIPALRDLKVYRPGYAIEYDFFDPTQLKHSLESKVIKGLFFAGQVNGTTGYEEAGGQGTLAGINAALKAGSAGLSNTETTFELKRDEAYIGVLIDDLVTKGVDEPYRMFTSRAEYRILLRQDDADMRLTPRGYAIGLVDETRYRLMTEKKECVEKIVEFCEMFHVKLSFSDVLASLGSSELKEGCKLLALVNRPELNLPLLAKHIPELAQLFDTLPADRRDEIIEAAEVQIKYAGYISREKAVAQKIARLEAIRLPKTIDYEQLQQLTIEARQKLTRIRPETIGQASRIPGVSPADVNILLVLLGR
jgi:tRNA uridine 5-carboxymethylaminomethyl modification enzyme